MTDRLPAQRGIGDQNADHEIAGIGELSRHSERGCPLWSGLAFCQVKKSNLLMATPCPSVRFSASIPCPISPRRFVGNGHSVWPGGSNCRLAAAGPGVVEPATLDRFSLGERARDPNSNCASASSLSQNARNGSSSDFCHATLRGSACLGLSRIGRMRVFCVRRPRWPEGTTASGRGPEHGREELSADE